MNVGTTIVDGVPYINGVRCIPAPLDHFSRHGILGEAFAPWLCPHCQAPVSKGEMLCLNLCGMTVPQMQRFNERLMRAYRKKIILDNP